MNNSNIEYKLLEETDLELMLDFVDDESTAYSKESLLEFISNKNNFGFIAKEKNIIKGKSNEASFFL